VKAGIAPKKMTHYEIQAASDFLILNQCLGYHYCRRFASINNNIKKQQQWLQNGI
jgi:hypothetical protein